MSFNTVTSGSDDFVERQNLLNDDPEQGKRLPSGVKKAVSKSDDFLQKVSLKAEERFNMKTVINVWGPRLEFVVRLLLVLTFFDDSLRTVTHFPQHMKEVGEKGCLSWLFARSESGASLLAAISLLIGLLAQSIGSFCIIGLSNLDEATKALLGWTVFQPILYGQLSNFMMVAESLSLAGGLLMIRARHVEQDGARTQFAARLLIPSMYIYYAGAFVASAFTLDETSSLGTYLASLSLFVINVAALVVLVIGAALVAFGLKSRLVALLLAFVNLLYVFYQHPFFLFLSRENGEWKYNSHKMYQNLGLPSSISMSDFDDPWEAYDLQRYYFFLGLSNSAALLLLAQFGPGEMAVEQKEVLLPTVRARD